MKTHWPLTSPATKLYDADVTTGVDPVADVAARSVAKLAFPTLKPPPLLDEPVVRTSQTVLAASAMVS